MTEKRSHKKRRLTMTIIIFLGLLALFLAVGWRNDIQVSYYTISSPKISQPLRLVLISDLHSCDYGPGQAELGQTILDQDPDLVLMAGDMVDDKMPEDKAWELMKALPYFCSCYYVTGNHEIRSGMANAYKVAMSVYNVRVLAGETWGYSLVDMERDPSGQGQTISISGVDDPAVGEAEFARQLAACGEELKPEEFNILLTHRPERAEAYAPWGYDLIVAGHAHGGQWRIPFTNQGLIAPNQGFFPKYSGGQYAVGTGTMIVSRGLARESVRLPRLFNRPEVVVVDLTPSTEGQ